MGDESSPPEVDDRFPIYPWLWLEQKRSPKLPSVSTLLFQLEIREAPSVQHLVSTLSKPPPSLDYPIHP
jgi:hypothetical protein